VSVLGSGKIRAEDPGYCQAVQLGAALAAEGMTVFHGGFRGVMEAVARGAKQARGHNVAVTIRKSAHRPNVWADAEIKMPSWQARLFRLIEVADAYIFLDGATGTLTELFVAIEMTNRGLLQKPVVILGRRLGILLRTLSKDPHFELPPTLHFTTSIPQAIRVLKAEMNARIVERRRRGKHAVRSALR